MIDLVVHCMRQHGFNLPAPDASGHVDTRGFKVNSRHFQAVAGVCVRFAKKQANG